MLLLLAASAPSLSSSSSADDDETSPPRIAIMDDEDDKSSSVLHGPKMLIAGALAFADALQAGSSSVDDAEDEEDGDGRGDDDTDLLGANRTRWSEPCLSFGSLLTLPIKLSSSSE